jgi:ParB family chromosome partitioning protein
MSAEDGRRKGLGRGLSALLGVEAGEYAQAAAEPRGRGGPREAPIEALIPNPKQPRRAFDDAKLDELAASIRDRGVLEPILVRRAKDDSNRYEIVAGERRWRAAQRARLHQVPIVVKELNDGEVLEVALIENIQREDLNAIDEGSAYQRLIDEFGHTQEALAKLLGKSRSHVANQMRLLSLPEPVQAMVVDGRLTAGHARALVTARDPAGLAAIVVAKGLSVRQTEAMAQNGGGAEHRRVADTPEKDADTRALEGELKAALGLKVAIDHKGTKGGTVTLAYRDLDQLDEIVRRLKRV